MVLLFPLGGENVEISWLLKKAEIARGDSRRKNSFKLTTARKLIFHLDQNPNVIWCQDIQHGCIEVLIRNFLGQVIGFLHLLRSEVLRGHSTFVPGGAGQAGGGAAGAGNDILCVGQNKACQVQKVTDHLAFDADVQWRVGVETSGKGCKEW